MAVKDPTIPNTFGALLIGYFVSLFLYGVFCAQVIWYHKTYPDDRRSFKIIVVLLWAVETIHSAIATETGWSYLVLRGSGNPFFFVTANWSAIAMVVPAELCVLIVDIFYILRIWRLVDIKKIALLPLIPVVVGWASSFGYVCTISRFPYAWQLYKTSYFLSVSSGCKVLSDIVIAVAMCVLLLKRQSKIARSKYLVKTLLLGTLTTGLLTSMFTVVYFSTYMTMPQNKIYVGVYLLHSKIYANAMLASLNTRQALRSIATQQIQLEEIIQP